MTDAVLLRDVIAIPEHAGTDDYVLKLTEGVGQGRIATTIDEYVVTQELARAFDQALNLVADAVQNRTSRAAFLSGSFGSGKSHFMAVLYALLGHDPAARAKPELAPVIARHDGQLQGKKVLRLAFHFLDAESVEQCVLGGYVAQIQALHPNAPLPAVHQSDALLADAENLRSNMGEDAFFAGLNESGGSASGSVWGALLGEGTWNAGTYDAARAAAPGSLERQNLVSALVKRYFTAFTRGAEFIDLDTGLAVISKHAQALGYDAVVLFLDELVLWLAFRVRDSDFFGREAQKITKFVEANNADRPIPLVTFVARQLDLRRYFNESGGGRGYEQESLDAAFRHQEGRFSTIVLGDDNLPFVAEKRLLQPVSREARDTLDRAFADIDRRPAVWDVLLDDGGEPGQRGADQAAFRRTYPFSPALVSTLRTLASAMQRDRTALKVMQQLLVRQRDTLTVDDVIPVGDTFDLVVQGTQAITAEMSARFRNAKELYDAKLRPLLLREHELTADAAKALPQGTAFHADDRLVKTLVLSAIAPEVPALKEITPSRLAALNHGSIVSPLPGQESSVVLAKLRRWAADVPEIQITADPRNPVIRLRIAEVDYESVVEKAKGEDNDARRRELLRSLVWEAFGFEQRDHDLAGVTRQTRVWRGSRRDVEVVFGNVRDRSWLPNDSFAAGSDTWRFVIDYPFDELGHSVREDDARVDELVQRGIITNTVVWLPHFVSSDVARDLGRLAILDWLLSGPGDRWTSMSNHLPAADRITARSFLETQQESLRNRLRRVVQEAYGAARPTAGHLEVDEAHERVLRSLNPQLTLQAPVGHDLASAFTSLLNQMFETSFPGHPRFEPGDQEVRVADLQRVLEAVEEAQQHQDGRALVEPAKRATLLRVANPLGIGHMGETHYLFSAERFPWAMRFAKAMGASGLEPADVVRVGAVRGWIRAVEPAPGLRSEVENLLIATLAVQQGRAWYRYGSPVPTPRLDSLPDDLELRPEPLPSREDWQKAVERAATILGITAKPYLTGANVNELVADVERKLQPIAGEVRGLVDALAMAFQRLSVPTDDAAAARYRTAAAVSDLTARLLSRSDAVATIETLARTPLPCTPEAAGRSVNQAAPIRQAITTFTWERLAPLLGGERGGGERGASARAALDRLRAALRSDELAQPLAAALRRADDDAFEWLKQVAPDPEPTPNPDPDPDPENSRRNVQFKRRVASRGEIAEVSRALERFFDDHGGRGVVVEWRVEP